MRSWIFQRVYIWWKELMCKCCFYQIYIGNLALTDKFYCNFSQGNAGQTFNQLCLSRLLLHWGQKINLVVINSFTTTYHFSAHAKLKCWQCSSRSASPQSDLCLVRATVSADKLMKPYFTDKWQCSYQVILRRCAGWSWATMFSYGRLHLFIMTDGTLTQVLTDWIKHKT